MSKIKKETENSYSGSMKQVTPSVFAAVSGTINLATYDMFKMCKDVSSVYSQNLPYKYYNVFREIYVYAGQA